MEKLSLNDLSRGTPGITSALGKCFAEAASVCLADRKHVPGVRLLVCGDFQQFFVMEWDHPTQQMIKAHADPEVATEFGACGIAVLLIQELTDYTVVERSRKGTGFDYWLGPRDSARDPDGILFQGKARLEVSGIRQGDESTIKYRVRQKINQTKRSDGRNLAAYIVVVEFGAPQSEVVKR